MRARLPQADTVRRLPPLLSETKDLGLHIYACETRPVLQGSRLTAWELMQGGIDVTLITDSMAAHTMKEKHISAVIVGADRIAKNGDTANKIGTYGLAILANAFQIPFLLPHRFRHLTCRLKTAIRFRLKREIRMKSDRSPAYAPLPKMCRSSIRPLTSHRAT